jgi:hypothetical protein
MKIKEHETVGSSGNDQHHFITIDWFARDWKILINDNCIKKITTIHLWDNSWRPFAGHTLNESTVYNAILNNEIIKLKYKVQ